MSSSLENLESRLADLRSEAREKGKNAGLQVAGAIIACAGAYLIRYHPVEPHNETADYIISIGETLLAASLGGRAVFSALSAVGLHFEAASVSGVISQEQLRTDTVPPPSPSSD